MATKIWQEFGEVFPEGNAYGPIWFDLMSATRSGPTKKWRRRLVYLPQSEGRSSWPQTLADGRLGSCLHRAWQHYHTWLLTCDSRKAHSIVIQNLFVVSRLTLHLSRFSTEFVVVWCSAIL